MRREWKRGKLMRRGENRRERDNRNRWRHEQLKIEDEQFKWRYMVPKCKGRISKRISSDILYLYVKVKQRLFNDYCLRIHGVCVYLLVLNTLRKSSGKL